MIIERYRSDYDGEFILLGTRLVDGKKLQEREWIPNPLDIDLTSPRAAVIGSNIDSMQFDHRLLEDHVGGIKGSLSLHTYGVGDLWKDMRFDYLAASTDAVVAEIASSDYSEKTAVYATAGQCIKYPGKFYIVPYQPLLSPMATAVYLAAFDGHKEIYLLGYNSEVPVDYTILTGELDQVITTFSGTKFIFVGVPTLISPSLRSRRNVRTMKFHEFVTHCDV